MEDGHCAVGVFVDADPGLDVMAAVAAGGDIEAPLAEVLTDFRAGRGVFPTVLPNARRLVVGDDQSLGGARFIRP